MKHIFPFLKLIRVVNLLIIAASMYLFQYCVIRLYLDVSNLDTTLNWFYFSLLVLATLLIAAAGNVANAYFDYEQDMEYKPDRVIVGHYFSLDTVFMLQMGMNVAGILIGFFLGYHFFEAKLGYIFLSAAALLWLYSQTLKKYFLIGNIVVAGLSAIVFVLPVLFEAHLTDYFRSDNLVMAAHTITAELKWYFLFAFLLSLVREIVKDAEDQDADRAYRMHTVPVVLPRPAVSALVSLLLLTVMIGVGLVQLYFWKNNLQMHVWYALLFIQFPVLSAIISAIMARSPKDYQNLSLLLKFIMLCGVASIPLFYWFILLQNSHH